MGHCIHVIVAPTSTADSISAQWPELPRLDRDNGFAIFPVGADLIDARIAPDKTPTETDDDGFMLLTDGFRTLLRALSRGGQLAYVETEYFGGAGGQGAVVCRDGEEIMPPEWHAGTINDALKLIGLKRGMLADRFAVAGFAHLRDDEEILNLIARQTAKNAPKHAVDGSRR